MSTLKFRSLALAILTLAASTAALAQDNAAAPQAAASSAAPAPVDAEHKVVCKRQPQVGSLIATRVCKTVAQWDLERDNATKMIGDMQQHTGSTGSR
jgi:hypothetical protein